MSLISLGLAEIQVGKIAEDGGEATSYTKIGKTYQNTCKLQQETADVTEHYEEGQAAPEVRKKKKKVPVLTFSIMDPDVTFLKDYLPQDPAGAENLFFGDEGRKAEADGAGLQGSRAPVGCGCAVQPAADTDAPLRQLFRDILAAPAPDSQG